MNDTIGGICDSCKQFKALKLCGLLLLCRACFNDLNEPTPPEAA